MKSLVLAPYVPFPPDHGGRIRSGVLCAALRELGEVVVACPLSSSEAEDTVAAAGELGLEVVALGEPEQRTDMRRKIGCWMRGNSELLLRRWSSTARQVAAAHIRRGDIDVVIADSSFALPLLDGTNPRPLVVHLHNVEHAVLARSVSTARTLRDSSLRSIERRAVRRVERRWLRRAQLVLTVSASDAALATDMAPRVRVEVVENSVDLAAMPQLPPAIGEEIRLLFVGSYDYPPNERAARELAVEHLPMLRERWPGLRVRLVGSDPAGALDDLRQIPGVEVVGRVRDLIDEYRRAHAVYLPIRDGGGTRLKVLEAFAFGRPVIGTAVAIEGLACEFGVHCLPCESPRQGVASLERMMDGDAERFVVLARRLVASRHAHPIAIARMVDVIGSLVSV